MSQDRFQTSREVYHRIRWDPRFDGREFVIGFDAHGEALEEIPFVAFVPDGEIPWHRVWYFRRGHEMVWDRRERIDRLSTLSFESPEEPAPPPAPLAPPAETTPRFTPLPYYRYDTPEAPLSGPPAPGGDALFTSDHFGLSCVLRRDAAAVQAVLTAPPVHQAAVVLLPPEDSWGPIQALRAVHDSKFERWMPHVTLLYPFVPEEFFGEAEALIAQALRDIEPFEVTLSSFGHFEHRASVTAWLRPEDRPHGALKALQAALEAALPQCDEQGRKSARGFTPHLSVGQLPRAAASDTRRTLAEWEKDWRPLRFEVREVCLISRRGNEPFEVRRRVPLGGGRMPVGDPL